MAVVGLPVQLEEDLLEVRRLRDEVDERVGGRPLDDRVDRGLWRGQLNDPPFTRHQANTVDSGEGIVGDRFTERHGDVAERSLAQALHGIDIDEPAGADDSDAVRDVLHLVERVRREEHRRPGT